jgi:ribonuclease R
LTVCRSDSRENSRAEYKRRRDLRENVVFTIDPVDAKDFDDALSLEILENGNFYLGVHIADVSHYVQPDSILDREAHQVVPVYIL